MADEKKITVVGVIQEGIQIGLKNLLSLLGAVALWFLTAWIPYINVGTTIAISTIPIELSKGKVISPFFIFDEKYRQYMGEYFNLIGLMFIAIIPALFFMIVPAYVIALGWSLAIFIMLDKGISPSEALVQSNKATYGYKWTIFFIYAILGISFALIAPIFLFIPFLGILLYLALIILFVVVNLGCSAVVYRNLTADPASAPAEIPAEVAPESDNTSSEEE